MRWPPRLVSGLLVSRSKNLNRIPVVYPPAARQSALRDAGSSTPTIVVVWRPGETAVITIRVLTIQLQPPGDSGRFAALREREASATKACKTTPYTDTLATCKSPAVCPSKLILRFPSVQLALTASLQESWERELGPTAENSPLEGVLWVRQCL